MRISQEQLGLTADDISLSDDSTWEYFEYVETSKQYKGVLWGYALSCFFDDPLAVAIPIVRVSTWKNTMGSMHRCLGYIDGTHGKKGHDSPEESFRGNTM